MSRLDVLQLAYNSGKIQGHDRVPFTELQTVMHEYYMPYCQNYQWTTHDEHQLSASGRIGLRYINEIRASARAWDTIIRPELLGTLGDLSLRNVTLQQVSEAHLGVSDTQTVLFRHGWLPQGTTVQPRAGEAVLDQPFYLVDIDAFEDMSSSTREGLPDLDELGARGNRPTAPG